MSLPIGFAQPTEKGFDDILDFALKAEREGFDLVTAVDHAFTPYEALSVLSAVAAETEEIGIGTAVIDANRRSPSVLAHATASLDRISGGRFILGIGRGVWNEATYGLTVRRPVSRMREIIAVVKKFWTEEEVSYRGSFFRFEGAAIGARPVQRPHPPVWVAGFGPRMLRIIGELGDGFITQNLPPKLFERDLRAVRESARSHGRDPDGIAGILAAPMAIASEYSEALRYVERTVRGAIFRRGGPPWSWARFMGREEPWEREEDVSMEVIDRSCVFGTPDDCIAKIERFMDRGVSCFTALPLYPIGLNSLEIYARKVIAYFKDI